jgi:FKBP-type peptidyl-prolyl cis-trans isomerase (trigger factor)
MGYGESWTEAMIADAQTFSADLKDNLDQIGIQEAFESWLSGAFSINGKTVIPKGQVEAMAKELGVTVKQLTEDLEMEGISVGEWVTEDGKIGEDFKELREQMIKDAEEAGQFDLGTHYQMLLELGLEDEEAKAQLNAMAGQLEDVPFTLNGETVKDASGIIYDS